MIKTHKIALMAAITTAFTFFGCSTGGGTNNNGENTGDGSGGYSSGVEDNGSSSEIEENSSSSSLDYGNFESVTIGTQTWMKTNLNVDIAGSKCYKNDPANCDKYGRLYDWATAMSLDTSCNTIACYSQVNEKHKGICPDGWNIPSDADWTTLVNYVGNTIAGEKLKSTSGWNGRGNGTDDFGFKALPGGYGLSDGGFFDVGDYGYWWSSYESTANYGAYRRRMDYTYGERVERDRSDKKHMFSVRCIKD